MENHIGEGMSKPVYMSLFSGCGGDSLGAEMAGYDVAYHVEWWGMANATHKANFPGCALLCRDITLLNGWKMRECIEKRVDVLFAGFPCQGFSRQGKRDKSDPRNRLFWEFVRIAKELEPAYAIGENVPGILDMPGENPNETAAGTVCRAFGEIGYDMRYKTLRACEYGAPTSRERVIFLGAGKGWKRPDFPAPAFAEKAQATVDSRRLGKFVMLSDAIAFPRPDDDIMARVSPLDLGRIRKIPQGKSLADVDASWKRKSSYRRPRAEKPFPTIIKTDSNWIHPVDDRFMSIRELARCQSFPDSFMFKGNYAERLGQIGNSVPPLLAKAVMEEVKIAWTESQRSKGALSCQESAVSQA